MKTNAQQAVGGKGGHKALSLYQAKPRIIEEPVQTDPMNIWNGWSGVVQVSGIRFRVTKKKVRDEHEVKAVYVLDAPAGTELYGLAGSSVYLTTGQIHTQKLAPNFSENSPLRARQQRMWDFFHKLFCDLGIKSVPAPRPSKDKVQAKRPSSSVESFLLKTLGVYSFESTSPRAVFELKLVPRFHKGANKKENLLNIEVISVDVGHPLHGYVRPGAKLFYDILARPAPDFKGDWAGDHQKIWEFLTDTLAAHKACKVSYSGKA